jgi:hypothetical protein
MQQNRLLCLQNSLSKSEIGQLNRMLISKSNHLLAKHPTNLCSSAFGTEQKKLQLLMAVLKMPFVLNKELLKIWRNFGRILRPIQVNIFVQNVVELPISTQHIQLVRNVQQELARVQTRQLEWILSVYPLINFPPNAL